MKLEFDFDETNPPKRYSFLLKKSDIDIFENYIAYLSKKEGKKATKEIVFKAYLEILKKDKEFKKYLNPEKSEKQTKKNKNQEG